VQERRSIREEGPRLHSSLQGLLVCGGKCRIRIYREAGRSPMAICSQLQDNENTSVTNMAEYLAAEVVVANSLSTPLTWVEHYPERRGALPGSAGAQLRSPEGPHLGA
jgi:hypothetical protein